MKLPITSKVGVISVILAIVILSFILAILAQPKAHKGCLPGEVELMVSTMVSTEWWCVPGRKQQE